MEELKILVDMVAHLPAMAIWVLAGFLAYKLAIVGSIYGTIRFLASELFTWLKQPKIEKVELRTEIDGITITGEMGYLMSQIHRLRGKGIGISSKHIHSSSIDWLKSAIDMKEEADVVAKRAREQADAAVKLRRDEILRGDSK